MGNTKETSNSREVSTRQRRIAELASQNLSKGITSLNHHIDLVWMLEAWRRVRKDGAAGVDGQTAAEYEKNLESNLEDLINRAKSGHYKAPPVKRVYIPKGKNQFRPIGIPTLEDKILQRAWVMLLEPIFEGAFSDSSYGFRPKRKAHEALEDLNQALRSMGGGWIIDADIEKFFDNVDRRQVQEFVRKRVRDGVIGRIIGKWMHAGVMEVLPQRFAKFHLTIHPEKTRMVDFRRPKPGVKGQTFDFVGFRFYWGRSRKGRSIIKWKTISARLSGKLNEIAKWCRRHRHDPVPEQCATLSRKLWGHYNYYGLTHNYRSLKCYYNGVCRVWRKWLNRRSRRRDLDWNAFNKLLRRHPLPTPKIVHSIYRRTAKLPF